MGVVATFGLVNIAETPIGYVCTKRKVTDIVLLSNLYSVIFFLWSAFVSMLFFDHQNSLILDLDKNIPN